MNPANDQAYFKTAAVQTAEAALDRCARDEILSVIIAEPGRGKSSAVKHWSKSNIGRVRHLWCSCVVRNGPVALLSHLAEKLGLVGMESARTDRVCLALAERLARDPVMVILDEADMLNIVCVQKLRGIWDEVRELRGLAADRAFPLALCGTTKLRDMMLKEPYEQLRQRVGEIEHLPGLSLPETTVVIGKKWANAQLDNGAIEEIHRMSRGSFRWLDKIMSIAGDLAAKDGKVINRKILEATQGYLVGLIPR